MMQYFQQPKQPAEAYNCSLSFELVLGQSETISSQTVVATSEGVDVTNQVIAQSSVSTDEKAVLFGVKGGVDGKDYKITVRVTTSAGQTLEEDIMMPVRDY